MEVNFNSETDEKEVVINDVLAKAGWTNVDSCRDLWRQKACPESVCVQSHGVIMVKFNANK